MTLDELMKAVDELSRQDFESLYDYIELRREYLAEERIRMIEEAVAEIREGFSKKDLERTGMGDECRIHRTSRRHGLISSPFDCLTTTYRGKNKNGQRG
jgi:hypothetical protein